MSLIQSLRLDEESINLTHLLWEWCYWWHSLKEETESKPKILLEWKGCVCSFSSPAHVSQMKGPKQQYILSRSLELLSEIKGFVVPSLPTTSVDSLTASARLLVTPMDLWYQFSSYATPVSALIEPPPPAAWPLHMEFPLPVHTLVWSD